MVDAHGHLRLCAVVVQAKFLPYTSRMSSFRLDMTYGGYTNCIWIDLPSMQTSLASYFSTGGGPFWCVHVLDGVLFIERAASTTTSSVASWNALISERWLGLTPLPSQNWLCGSGGGGIQPYCNAQGVLQNVNSGGYQIRFGNL